jgi:hypothetical protein
MTDFTFARVGLRNSCFLLSKEPGQKSDKDGLDNIRTVLEDLQRCENLTLFAEMNELFKTIRLKIVKSVRKFTFSFSTSVYQNCNTLQIQNPNSIYLIEFSFQRSVIYVPNILF